MLETLLEYFQGTPLSLWGPFFILLLCGLGVPVPEDVVLIAAGVLGQIDGRSWVQVSGFMYLGVLIGDSMIFFAGKYLGTRLLASAWLRRIVSPEKQAKVEDYFIRHGSAGLFIGRFLPGLRAPIFFTAGSMKVSYLKFLCFDGAAALISVPVFVWLGHWLWLRFQDNIEEFNRALSRTHSYTLFITFGLAVLLVVAIGLWIRRARKKA
ncbi:MAG: DedA family protein [Opitutaceae bacterium]|nr:DedA family protein [Opitutaceae bacterium]MBP9912398.1 DedA family protein [Opitutaceae bacterium]